MAELRDQVPGYPKDDSVVEPVDFRELCSLLPTSLKQFKRSIVEGERTGMMGATVSKASATYEVGVVDNVDGRIQLQISDMGAIPHFSMLGMAWMFAEIDRESSTGFERTTTYQGHKSMEKYDHSRQQGQMQVVVAGRFIIETRGRNVSMKAIRDAVSQIDIQHLESMKDTGREVADEPL